MARPNRMTAQVSALIPSEQRAAMDSIADDFEKSFADVLRECVDLALPRVVEKYDELRRLRVSEETRAARRG